MRRFDDALFRYHTLGRRRAGFILMLSTLDPRESCSYMLCHSRTETNFARVPANSNRAAAALAH